MDEDTGMLKAGHVISAPTLVMLKGFTIEKFLSKLFVPLQIVFR